MSAEHVYDNLGICAKCDRCLDAGCCEQVACDSRAWDIDVARARVRRAFEKRQHQGDSTSL